MSRHQHLKMRNEFRFLPWLTLLLLTLVISACQDRQTPIAETEPTEEMPTENVTSDSYPVINTPLPTIEVAYPITKEELQLIYRTWQISTYFENGYPMDSGRKSIQFNQDGTYEIITGENVRTGLWEAWLYAAESTLIFDPGSPDALYFDIMDLQEEELFLHSIIDGVHIDETFLPAN